MKLASAIVATLLGFVSPLVTFAGIFGPSDYDECILDSMKGVTSDKAAILIARSCREKFPKDNGSSKNARTLSREELGRLTGRAGISEYTGDFSGTIYNGNAKLTVSSVTLQLTTTVDGEPITRAYTKNFTVAPNSTSQFAIDVILDGSISKVDWRIESATGY